MKIKEGFMLRLIADTWVVVPIGEKVIEFNGIISLSETGAFLWNGIEKGLDINSLVDSLAAEYNVDKDTAFSDTTDFLEVMERSGLIES